MSINAGIVGLPNVGKSTIFSALTAQDVQAENYPFCTIEPNKGLVEVPDNRLKFISNYIPTNKLVYATCEFIDIAGLVKGASKGEGLGNKFLNNIREASIIVHIVRCFKDDNILRFDNKNIVSPKDDIETINLELLLSDLEIVERKIEKLQKDTRSPIKDIVKKANKFLELLEKIKNSLEDYINIRDIDLNEEENILLSELNLITRKRVLYVCNVDDSDIEGLNDDNLFESYDKQNEYVKEVLDYVKDKEDKDFKNNVIKICGSLEKDIALLSKEDRDDFLNELSLKEPSLNRLVRECYFLMGLKTFFTAGEPETRAWTFKDGYKAPDTAGIIHTDFKTGFIKAEVYDYHLLKKYKTIAELKKAGKIRLEGKDYLVKDGDVIFFKFNN